MSASSCGVTSNEAFREAMSLLKGIVGTRETSRKSMQRAPHLFPPAAPSSSLIKSCERRSVNAMADSSSEPSPPPRHRMRITTTGNMQAYITFAIAHLKVRTSLPRFLPPRGNE